MDPTSHPYLGVESRQPGWVVFQAPTLLDRLYCVERASSLAPTAIWEATWFGELVGGEGVLTSFAEDLPADGDRFHRLRIVPLR